MNTPRSFTAALLLLTACTGVDPESWSSPADCEAIGDEAVRDDCYARVAAPVFAKDRDAGLALLEKVSDPLVRDYILLKVTREVDPTSFQYCDKMQDERLKERCQVLVRRPHLHRDLQGRQGKEGGPGSGPPKGPGAGGPDGKAPGGPPPKKPAPQQ